MKSAIVLYLFFYSQIAMSTTLIYRRDVAGDVKKIVFETGKILKITTSEALNSQTLDKPGTYQTSDSAQKFSHNLNEIAQKLNGADEILKQHGQTHNALNKHTIHDTTFNLEGHVIQSHHQAFRELQQLLKEALGLSWKEVKSKE